MNKKLAAVLIIVALVLGGASAQLMLGVSGALPMDAQMSAEELKAAFTDGSAIMYGGFVELGLGKLGIGVSMNTNSYDDTSFYGLVDTIDGDAYISLHLFGAKAFLDPFGELGGGIIGTMYDPDNANYSSATPFLDASYYWYAAVGAGVNLGPVGIFGKLAYNYALDYQVEYKDENGDTQTLLPFGTAMFGYGTAYLPAFRFTLGAKLIL